MRLVGNSRTILEANSWEILVFQQYRENIFIFTIKKKPQYPRISLEIKNIWEYDPQHALLSLINLTMYCHRINLLKDESFYAKWHLVCLNLKLCEECK